MWRIITKVRKKLHTVSKRRINPVCQICMQNRYWKFMLTILLVAIVVCCLYLLLLSGCLERLEEIPFSKFRYPKYINVSEFVKDYKVNNKYKNLVTNIFNHKFLTYPSLKCQIPNKIFLMFLIKSKPDNIEKRNAMRQTWANNEILASKSSKRIFLIGKSKDKSINENVKNEVKKYNDILLIDFTDSYYNNTIKTFNGLRWLYEFCENVDFTMIVDDDFFVATESIVAFLKTTDKNSSLLMGFANPYLEPVRCKICKWYIPVSEYPFDKYPPYLSGGALLMTALVAKSIYIATKVVEKFKLDDIYLAIIAHKLGIPPKHNEKIHVNKVSYTNPDFRNILASHGYEKREEFYRAWQCHKHNICNFHEGFRIHFILFYILVAIVCFRYKKEMKNILRMLIKTFRKSPADLRV